MPQFGYEPGIGQRTHRPKVFDVHDHGLVGLAVAQVGHDTIITCGGVAHDAGVAVDNRVVAHVNDSTQGV